MTQLCMWCLIPLCNLFRTSLFIHSFSIIIWGRVNGQGLGGCVGEVLVHNLQDLVDLLTHQVVVVRLLDVLEQGY